MTRVEYDVYLKLVQGSITSRLDDGESAAIALASQGYAVILDENKARGVVSKDYPNIHFCSTFRLLLTAAREADGPSSASNSAPV